VLPRPERCVRAFGPIKRQVPVTATCPVVLLDIDDEFDDETAVVLYFRSAPATVAPTAKLVVCIFQACGKCQ
jgi:hypothetical protein